MSSPKPPEPEGSAAVLELYARPDGRWLWCYREPEHGVELHSNLDFATREEAAASARRAYPDVAFRLGRGAQRRR
ncbi:MAG: hypothetical protein AB1679_16270 [Actinomycetota bacterium]|jgi:hypothetical protein